MTNKTDKQNAQKPNNPQLIEDLIEICHKSAPDRNLEALSNFIHLFIDKFSKDYLQKSQKKDLINIINAIWEAIEEKKNSKPIIKIKSEHVSYHKTERLFITVINNDRPYLVDSLQIILAKWKLKPQFFLHPVFNIKRHLDTKTGKITISHLEAHSPKRGSRSSEVAQESIIFVQTKNHFPKDKVTQLKKNLSDVLEQLELFMTDQEDIINDLLLAKEHLQEKKNLTNQQTKQSQKRDPDDQTDTYLVDDISESVDFLTWLKDHHFLFLGSRYFSALAHSQTIDFFCIEEKPESSKGIFKPSLMAESDAFVPFLGRSSLIPDENRLPTDKPPLIRITKTSQRSNIQRASRLDLIEVLDWDKDGKSVKGIYQFVGVSKKTIYN